ncbi:MAG: hypothetical protein IJV45_08880, partial [Prevotella sp.]|nr:hypothetical protein [Prevotella sp.]
ISKVRSEKLEVRREKKIEGKREKSEVRSIISNADKTSHFSPLTSHLKHLFTFHFSLFTFGFASPAWAQTEPTTVAYGADASQATELRTFGVVSSNGSVKAQTYDVAIGLHDASLVGTRITRMRIPFVDTQGISDVTVWLSRSLTLSNKLNQPDVMQQTVEPSQDGWMEVALDEPYTITDEGVYAGYSLTNSTAAPRPLCLVPGSDADLYWLHSTATYRQWRNQAEDGGLNLAMNVVLDGVPANRAGLAPLPSLTTQADTPTRYAFTLLNHGATPITDIDFTYSVGGTSATLHHVLAKPLEAHYNLSRTVSFELPALGTAGNDVLTVSIDRVNGHDNDDPTAARQADALVYELYPRHRVVVEEYTGTWCGNCPRGFVGMEKMERLHPDDFIGISYHNNDPMQFITAASYPWNAAELGDFPGYPTASIERKLTVDPYFGISSGSFHLDDIWLMATEQIAPAAVEAEAWFTDAAQTVVNVQATVRFPLSVADNRYRLSYILTANGLTGTGSSWDQVNYYSGASASNDPDMDVFTQGAEAVSGLTYNFVAVQWSGQRPVESSLPTSVTGVLNGGQPLRHDYQFAIAQNNLIQHKDKLVAVVLLVDTETGYIENAAKAAVALAPTDGISQMRNEQGTMNNAVYDLQGRVLNSKLSNLNSKLPQKGIYVSNGRKFVR